MSKNNLLLKILTLGELLLCMNSSARSLAKFATQVLYLKYGCSTNTILKLPLIEMSITSKKKSWHPMDSTEILIMLTPRNLLRVDLLITLKARPSSLRTHSCHNTTNKRQCSSSTDLSATELGCSVNCFCVRSSALYCLAGI